MIYSLNELFLKIVEEKASDLHFMVGAPPIMRKNGDLIRLGNYNLRAEDTEKIVRGILGDKFKEYLEIGELDTSYAVEGIVRFRINAFMERGSHAMAMRVIPSEIPTLDELNHPLVIKELVKKKRGLVLVTGPTGSGKSTTLAAMIEEINNSRDAHIITLEDPIEYLHRHNKSIINQREIGKDSKSYENALKAILREDPDVVLVGEMRDIESISITLTAAETGHLVLSTLHTIGAAKTIDRIIDVFPPYQQQQIKIQLAAVLEGIISQQLLPSSDNKGRVAAIEVMTMTSGIQNLIREGKTYQIESAIQTGSKFGMKTMDSAIAELERKGMISRECALNYCVDKEMIKEILLI